jgi:hypothetical protein
VKNVRVIVNLFTALALIAHVGPAIAETDSNQNTNAKPAASSGDLAKKFSGHSKKDDLEVMELAVPAFVKEPEPQIPSPAEVFEALKTYDVESLEKRLAKVHSPNAQYNMYMAALAQTTNPQRMAEIYAMHGLAEMWDAPETRDKSLVKVAYSSALTRIVNGGMISCDFFKQVEFRVAVKKVFAKCGMTDKQALEFVYRGAARLPLTLRDYNPAASSN